MEKKELTDLALRELRRKYPNVPEYALPKKKVSDTTANGLTKSILTWLTLNGHYCSRIQSQGQFNPTLKRWTKSTVRRGIGDVMAIINGRTIMIEVKAGRDKLSKYQERTRKEVERSGGVYIMVRTFDEFMNWYKNKTSSSPLGTE